MKLYYKDYELPSFQVNDNGYLLPWDENINNYVLNNLNYHSDTMSDVIINTEDNDAYFMEANILSKINLNEEGYFNFNKAIIDIGAYVGCYSFRSFFKYVYAFEPNKIMFTCLNMNLLIHNKLKYSKTFNVLLSDKKEDINYDGMATYLADINAPFNKQDSQIVKSNILDEFNCENVGLIKIDVEGMEEKVLRGGLGTIIRNNYPPILFECWEIGWNGMTREKQDSMKYFLNNLGYTILWNWGDNETHLAIHKSFYNK